MELANLLNHIIQDNSLHAKWLNTLSMMENTGARKISASENKTGVTLMVLKHAAEEARHAYYLKKQIGKLSGESCPDYSAKCLLSPFASMHYMESLDMQVCRYLKDTYGFEGQQLKFGAYLLVTYAIEVRADELYAVYQDALTNSKSKVNVKSIIAEEVTHLAEMLSQMESFFQEGWEAPAKKACKIENGLFDNWIKELDAGLN
jgi:hypothetical protein